ncbi:hypothetical protein MMC27_007468 [Xylographa pallens]|nr:hypothetical protein [Xylographa pallens]
MFPGSVILPGILVNSISVASSSNALIPQYPKLDRSGFSFYGRSYGVAAGVGLIDDPTSTAIPDQALFVENYTFSETGYLSDVTCIFNETSDIYFQNLEGVNGGTPKTGNWSGYVIVQQATGSLPTGPWRGFTTMAIADNCTATALAAGHNDTQYIYALAIGHYYPNLTNVQCKVDFTPTSLDIAVNVTAQNISVIPATDQTQTVDIDPTRALVNNTFTSLNFLCQIITTMYTSVLGDAFMVNVDAVTARRNHTMAMESDILTAVSESLELLLDEYFGALAASQLPQYNQSHPSMPRSVQLGEPFYAYITFGINIAVILLFLYESIRTGFWQNLPAFNLLNTKSASLGAARAVAERHLPQEAQAWEGDAADRQAGALKVELSANGTVLKLSSDVVDEVMLVSPALGLGEVPLRPIHHRHDSENSLGDLEHLIPP